MKFMEKNVAIAAKYAETDDAFYAIAPTGKAGSQPKAANPRAWLAHGRLPLPDGAPHVIFSTGFAQ
jgi:hypothetical protein